MSARNLEPLVDRDLGIRQGGARIPEVYGADGPITTILIIFWKASDCSPLRSRTCSCAARSQPQQRFGPIRSGL
jgi:hypothetical protein